MHEHRTANLSDFVSWTKQHITGDEKGQAQVFLDRLFKAFSQQGVMEAGATLEQRIKKNDKGGTAFADLVWKPKVLIEMKKRGADLSQHLQQAFDYWVRLVPGRPKYVILCNFDQFRIYDFDVDISEPQDIVTLDELPERYLPLAFLFPTDERPQFKIDRVKVTREAADKLAAVYNRLEAKPNVGPETAQRFILQMLVALFSEDIGFLPKGFVAQLLDECTDPPRAFDLLNGLFTAMNTPPLSPSPGTPGEGRGEGRSGVLGGRFKGVPYFNGGLFAHPAPVELDPAHEGFFLREAAAYNWSHISPDIFGTLFQHSMGKEQRHAFGAHYTAPTDIMKIVKPTIVDPFRTAIDRALDESTKEKKTKALAALRKRLQTLRILDPACGSGNFLYIAYREMRRLENEIAVEENRLAGAAPGQMTLGGVSPTQFFGLDILPFAVELAKVTLAIAPKLASDELHTSELTLPLANLDQNIVRRDALLDSLNNPASWPAADVIIGNPPFLGSKLLKPERGANYVNSLRRAYPEIPGMADYCVYWFRKASEHLPPCTLKNPFSGRGGLVGTQNIRNNQSRVGGLDKVVETGTIIEAVDNQPWSGEANVSVSIVNWIASQDVGVAPAKKRLWGKLAPKLKVHRQSKGQRADKQYELSVRECRTITAALSDGIDLTAARVLRCNTVPSVSFQGVVPGYPGFVLSHDERRRLIRENKQNAKVVKPYLIGDDLVAEVGGPSRSIIDFGALGQFEARKFKQPWSIVEQDVLPEVAEKVEQASGSDMVKARQDHLDRWWQFWNVRVEMRVALAKLNRYVAIPRVTKRQVLCFVSSDIVPDCQVQAFAFEDDYSFGILASGVHWAWFLARCSKLTERLRYIRREVFDTFPWPQSPTKRQIDAVAAAAVELRRVRSDALQHLKGGLRALYRTLELPGKSPLKDAHASLDSAVLAAYNFDPKADLLSQLLALNQQVAAAEKAGQPVTPPGIPPTFSDASTLITDDCITP